MKNKTIKVACIGECMIELAHRSAKELQLGFGGDTLNTAIYLNRLVRGQNVTVDYVTALGDDVYSDMMLAGWQAEGLGTELVARLPGRFPGLYTIRTDASGERSFSYWRGQSAARHLLEEERASTLAKGLEGYDLIYLSGITLSILDQSQRQALFDLIESVRDRGALVAFDGNFRPAGWNSSEEARSCFNAILTRTDIALPTFDDERMLESAVNLDEVVKHHHDLGVSHVVVKLGADGCFLSSGNYAEIVATSPIETVIDSTAAGDSFNAGFLASFLLGKTAKDAASYGHAIASRVLGFRGAIIPNHAMPDLDDL